MGTWDDRLRKRRAAVPPETPRHRSKKDTKRWCRGKPGREHKPQWVAHHSHKRWMQKVCTECGKQLEHCWPWGKDSPCKCGFHRK